MNEHTGRRDHLDTEELETESKVSGFWSPNNQDNDGTISKAEETGGGGRGAVAAGVRLEFEHRTPDSSSPKVRDL